jgi:hypothetical protein
VLAKVAILMLHRAGKPHAARSRMKRVSKFAAPTSTFADSWIIRLPKKLATFRHLEF